jgi:WD40 repeat protein
MKNWGLIISVIFVASLLGSCKSNANAVAQTSEESSTSSTFSPAPPTPTPTPSATRTKYPTHVPTITNTPTETPLYIQNPKNISQIGTPLPQGNQTITLNNITSLAQVGQWGYGAINDAIYTQDGTKIIVSSSLGFAIYDLMQPKEPPLWVPFPSAYYHNFFMLDEDENFIRLMKFNEDLDEVVDELILTFPEGLPVENPRDIHWINPLGRPNPEEHEPATSSDGKKVFDANREPLDPNWIPEEGATTTFISKNYILDAETEEILFQLPDDTLIRSYSDYVEPEGCTITSTSMCSTSHWDLVYLPYRTIFSPNDQTFIVRYSENLPFYTPGFQNTFLRLYDADDGTILGSFGSPTNPVQAFSYAPDGDSVLIAYENGSIQTWNITQEQIAFSAWHFNEYASSISFSENGKFALIKREDYLEIRSTIDGALKSRLQADQFRFSSIDEDVIAYTDSEYHIRLLNIETSESLLNIPAHENKIFTIEFSPDGNYIASSSQDCTIKLWDAKTGQFLHYFEETLVDPMDPYFYNTWEPERNAKIYVKRFEFVEGTKQLFGFSPWWIAVNWNIDSGATSYVIYGTPELKRPFHVDMATNEIYFGNMIYSFDTGEIIGGEQSSSYTEEKFFPQTTSSFYLSKGYELYSGFKLYDEGNSHLGTLDLLPKNMSGTTISSAYFSSDDTFLYVTTNIGVILIYQISE